MQSIFPYSLGTKKINLHFIFSIPSLHMEIELEKTYLLKYILSILQRRKFPKINNWKTRTK